MLFFLHDWVVRKTFKYRLYPTKKQAALLDEQLAEACRLYNAALQERRDAWKMRKISLSYYQHKTSCGTSDLLVT
jgi:putative transposase